MVSVSVYSLFIGATVSWLKNISKWQICILPMTPSQKRVELFLPVLTHSGDMHIMELEFATCKVSGARKFPEKS